MGHGRRLHRRRRQESDIPEDARPHRSTQGDVRPASSFVPAVARQVLLRASTWSPSRGCSPQYINAVWFKTDAHKAAIDAKVAALQKQGVEVNTRIAPVGPFYRAEEYHQKYFAK